MCSSFQLCCCALLKLSTSFITLATASRSPSLSLALPVIHSFWDSMSLFQSGFPPDCTITNMSRCTSTCGPLETSLHPDVIADLLKDSSINSHRSIVVECLTCLSKRNSLRLSMNSTQEPQIHNNF